MSGRQARRALLLALLLGLSFAAGKKVAHAASFDCAKASTARERTICADPKLSKLDGDVAGLYRQALTQLSPEGARGLREGERRWLAYLGTACSSSMTSDENRTCLSQAYDERRQDLQQAAVRIGPYLFTRVDLYGADLPPPSRANDPLSDDHRSSLRHVAYPQIDHPGDAAALKWNRLAVRAYSDSGSECGDNGEVVLDYRLGLATSRLISVTWTDWGYCYGMAHGNGSSHAETTMLSPAVRPLKPEDLFRRDRRWQVKLTELLRKAVEKEARDDDDDADLSHLNAQAIAGAAASPQRWWLKTEGLAVAFDSYELGEGYAFAPEVVVPWSELADVLASPGPTS